MPHLFLEYSANVAEHHDISEIIDAVHDAALTDGLPPIAGLRTRGVARTHYAIAGRDPLNAFVAITARIGPGRSTEAKNRFLTAILDAAEAALDNAASPLAIAWSAEIQEIDADSRINRNHIRARMKEDI